MGIPNKARPVSYCDLASCKTVFFDIKISNNYLAMNKLNKKTMDRVVIIDAEKFAEYDNRLRQMAEDLEFLRKKVQVTSKALYTNRDVATLFDVTANTLKNYRNSGQLGFSKVGDKFFYTPDDIALFLSKSHREAFY